MEKMKAIDEILTPDERNLSFVKIQEGKTERIELKDMYDSISQIVLVPSVPDKAKNYFEILKNICIYGWFHYPLYTTAYGLSLMAIEMALRERFVKEDPHRKWPFKKLLKKAVELRLIKAGEFSHVKARWEESKRLEKETGGLIKALPETEGYCKILIDTIPYLRNAFAHPTGMLLAPGQAIFGIKVAAELINQLFTEEEKKNANNMS